MVLSKVSGWLRVGLGGLIIHAAPRQGPPAPFFFARSCLGKVPGRAPFSQLSQRATACTIRMQIVKQINENELDIKKRINQSGQLISK